MKFLIDGSPARVVERKAQWPDGVLGQLLTPITSFRSVPDMPLAIDNGAYSGFNQKAFERLISREAWNYDRMLFIAYPDVVGDHAATLALWENRNRKQYRGWKLAFVAQDGCKDFPPDCEALFIGGTDLYKESPHALAVAAAGVAAGLHVHVGRVNTPRRFKLFAELGAHTCDGSAISRIENKLLYLRSRVTK